jgi:hypothetical protein
MTGPGLTLGSPGGQRPDAGDQFGLDQVGPHERCHMPEPVEQDEVLGGGLDDVEVLLGDGGHGVHVLVAVRLQDREAEAGAQPLGVQAIVAELGARYFLTLHEWAQWALDQYDQDG